MKSPPEVPNMSYDAEGVSKTLKLVFILLYIQFAGYWGTLAMGMLANYYYTIPDSLQPTFPSIVHEIFTNPILIVHVAFAIQSTAMSIPVIFLARRVHLGRVAWMHAGAITARLGGFIGGPAFLYFSSNAIGNATTASYMTFMMAVALITAIILSFGSRIFIVREDVRVKYDFPQAKPQSA